MFGSLVAGKTVTWCPAPDPPGSWALVLADRVLAELAWSPPDGGVRIEVGSGAGSPVWRVRFAGARPLRALLCQGPDDVPRIAYAGYLNKGLARSRDGREFELFLQSDRERGPWAGWDSIEGDGVLRIRGRMGGGGFWSEVTVTPDPGHADATELLLFLWGALRILREHRRWLVLSTLGVSDRAIRSALDELALASGPLRD